MRDSLFFDVYENNAYEILNELKLHGGAGDDVLKKSAEKFVSLANERGGNDNITVVLIY